MSDADPFDSLVWSCDTAALRNLHTLPPTSWAGAIQQDIRSFTPRIPLFIPRQAFPPYLPAAVVTMVKDEGDIIYDNLAWLHRMGARRFGIINNNSTDSTGAEIHRFASFHADTEVLVLNDPDLPHFQQQKVSAMARRALQTWPDLRWIIAVDADEFCFALDGFTALDNVPDTIDALCITKVIHHLTRDAAEEDSAGARPYARMPVRSAPFGLPPKVFARATPTLVIAHGNHKLVADTPPRYAGGLAHGFYLREFQIRGFRQLVRRISNGGAAVLAAKALGHDVGGDHWLDWYRLLQEQGEAGMRRRFLQECWREAGGAYVRDPFDPEQIVASAGDRTATGADM